MSTYFNVFKMDVGDISIRLHVYICIHVFVIVMLSFFHFVNTLIVNAPIYKSKRYDESSL